MRQSLLFFLLFCLIVIVLGSILNITAEAKIITILQTSDLHGYLMPWDYYTNKPAELGLAKVATLIEQERAKNPNLVLIDDGDTIQGSPLAYYYNKIETQSPHPIATAFNTLGFDAVSLGNHDFDFGMETLSRWIEQLEAPVVCANLRRIDGISVFKPYLIKEVGGVKIGILGLTTPSVKNWLPPENFGGFSFIDPIKTAQEYVPQMRQQGADIVIVAQHTGWTKTPKDYRLNPASWLTSVDTWKNTGATVNENVTIELAQKVEGIDIILAGHSHLNVPKAVINNVLIAEPSYWGKALSKYTIKLSRQGKKWQIIDHDATNLSVEKIQPLPRFVRLLQPEHQKVVSYLNQPIGKSASEFVGGMAARFKGSALAHLINTVQMEAARSMGYPVDMSLTSIFTNQGKIPSGEITRRDAYSIYVYDNRLFILEINGNILRRALEKNAAYFKQINGDLPDAPQAIISENMQDYHWDIYQGIDYTIDITKPVGQRVTRLLLQGKEIQPEKVLRVAINSYRALGGGEFSMFTEGKVLDKSKQEVRELIAEYLSKKKTIHPQDYEDDNLKIEPDIYNYYLR
ncbi:bifunctional metallophosphatase/5'-nucleotidase [Limnoraphis robusta]|uniref:bifunctional metallophosphatase/5'-nucleotidase n=1 Tax=Limnoraphis robusta TaxID=1118279 RepID=UPI00066B40EB|nr:5'-nucleotidase C-terminal domain-containing protein [Limnoraphis robusta]